MVVVCVSELDEVIVKLPGVIVVTLVTESVEEEVGVIFDTYQRPAYAEVGMMTT